MATSIAVEEQLLLKMDEILKAQAEERAERSALQLILMSCVANYVVERDDAPEWLAQCMGAAVEGVKFSDLDPAERSKATDYVTSFFNAFGQDVAAH